MFTSRGPDSTPMSDRPFVKLLPAALLLVLLPVAAARAAEEDRVLSGHKDYVMAAAYSPDSRYLASGGYDGTAAIWEAASGRLLRTLAGHTDSVTSVAFSHQGGVLATGSFDGTAKLWEASTGDELMTLSGHVDWVMSVAFHPDSAWLATASFDGTAKLWDLRTGLELRSFEGHRGGVNGLAFSPDGKLLATASDDRTAKLWDVFTGEEARTFPGHGDAVRTVAWSPDGAWLATGSNDRTAAVWDAVTRRKVAALIGHKGWVYGVAFSAEGRYLATCSGDKTVKLWEVEPGMLVRNYTGHREGVNGVAFSPDGWSLASASDDRTVRIWPIPFEPVRRLPPRLYARMEFNDENGDGILEASETARVHLILHNEGQGPAQRVRISLEDDLTDPALSSTAQSVRAIGPGGKSEATIILKAGLGVRTARHRMRVRVREYYGYDMDPVYLLLQTKAITPPAIAFSGVELVETGPGTAPIAVDGALVPGESARLRVLLQNTGMGIARGISYSIYTTDPNIYLGDAGGTLGDIRPGEIRSIMLTVSPNKRVVASGPLPVYLTIRDRIGMLGLTNIQLPLELGKAPPPPAFAPARPESVLAEGLARFEFESPKFSVIPREDLAVTEMESSLTSLPQTAAVVFGLGRYRSLPEVPYAAGSARLVRRYLEARLGVGLCLAYFDQDASGLIFDEVFNPDYGRLRREMRRGYSDVVVYYRGHLLANRERDEIYLFPSDGRPDRLEAEGYPLSAFYASLGRLGARSVTVIIDAAVEPGDRGSKLKLGNPKPWTVFPAQSSIVTAAGEEPARVSETGFTVINACEGYLHAAPHQPSELSLLAHYLAAGLKGHADHDGDRRLTLGELKKYLTEKVTEKSWRIAGLQVPEVYGDDGKVLVEW